jgi:hypothetical protein
MSRARHHIRSTPRGIRTRCAAVTVAGALLCPHLALCQGYDDSFEMRSKLKVELQYADYSEYEYPEPVLFGYGISPYVQNEPYVVNFPEWRGLIKYTRLFGAKTAVSMKYQFSDIKAGITGHYFEGKVTRTLSSKATGLLSGAYLYDSRGFGAFQGGGGLSWEFSPITLAQVDAQYYHRGSSAAALGGKMGSLNLRAKFRQVLTISTALMTEYSYYNASGDAITFQSHNAAVWLSQFLPTQTAVHASLRLYTNTAGIRSFSPSLEIGQYLNWATVLLLKFRYYENKSDNVSFGEEGVLIPDGLISRTFSAQLNREMSATLLLYLKYRYYNSSLGVAMHTYMLGGVWSF